MALMMFRCANCDTTFQVPSEKIPPGGATGRCKSCGTALQIFPDGRAVPVAATAPAPQAPAPQAPPPVQDDPIWSVKIHSPQGTVEVMNNLRLAEVREMILSDRLLDTDHLRVYDGEWTPGGAFPAISKFFVERVEQLRELHGDEERCAHHKDTTPGWQCLKCSDYLCEQCVVNKPLLEGGEARYLCLVCDFDTRTLAKKTGLSGALKGILKKK